METRIGKLSTAPVQNAPASIRPERFAGRRVATLAKSVGLTQFGVNHVTLPPGGYSSLRHWHEREDEFVLVTAGELVLIDEAGEHLMAEGDFAGFAAGVPNAHHLANRSNGPASYLVVGTRVVGEDVIHYPDDPEIRVAKVTRGPDGDRV